MAVVDAVEAEGEVEAEVEMGNRAVEITNGAATTRVNTYGRIVLAIEMVHAMMVFMDEAEGEAEVDNMISNNTNHTTHSSSSICICLLLQWLNRIIYHLCR